MTSLGQPASLDLQTAASRPEGSTLGVRTVLRPFHGHITQVTRLGANGGFARYQLIIEPWLAFLGHNQDNYLFQDKSVIEIIDELLADWKTQGKLVPDWRWKLSDPAAYPKRGMTVQYRETDLAFLKRILAEEGLFCWFEHKAEDGDTLGSHTLIIADHNGAFTDNPQSLIRFTQAGATLAEDSLDRWHGLRQLDTVETNASSWDYLKIEGGNIQLHAPGKVELKASQKNLTGPKGASTNLPSWNVGELNLANPPERKATCLLAASRSGAAFVQLDK